MLLAPKTGRTEGVRKIAERFGVLPLFPDRPAGNEYDDGNRRRTWPVCRATCLSPTYTARFTPPKGGAEPLSPVSVHQSKPALARPFGMCGIRDRELDPVAAVGQLAHLLT